MMKDNLNTEGIVCQWIKTLDLSITNDWEKKRTFVADCCSSSSSSTSLSCHSLAHCSLKLTSHLLNWSRWSFVARSIPSSDCRIWVILFLSSSPSHRVQARCSTDAHWRQVKHYLIITVKRLRIVPDGCRRRWFRWDSSSIDGDAE